MKLLVFMNICIYFYCRNISTNMLSLLERYNFEVRLKKKYGKMVLSGSIMFIYY